MLYSLKFIYIHFYIAIFALKKPVNLFATLRWKDYPRLSFGETNLRTPQIWAAMDGF